MLELATRIHRFLTVDLWREVPTPSRVRAALLHIGRVSMLAGRDFVADKCAMRATALSYVTLLSIVPLLAFAFSVMKGLGVQAQLEGVLGKVAAGQKEVLEQIIGYVEDTNVKALGTIGLVFLIWTVVKTLGTIERSFNEIWGVTQSRSYFRKFTDYVSVLVTAPLLMVAAMSLSGFLQGDLLARFPWLGLPARLAIRLMPFVGTWIAFAAVYMFMPNTSVRLRSALVGGVIAGTIWQLAFWLYTTFQVGMAKYNAIYGTFAALPIFMVWLYMSWTIVLFGAEVAWATQNVGTWWEQRRAESASFATKEEVALRAMTALAVSFYGDGEALSGSAIAHRFKAPTRLVRDVLRTLCDAGLCSQIAGEDGPAYQPARALEHLTPADVLAALRTEGDEVDLNDTGPGADLVAELLGTSEAPRREILQRTTFREIAASVGEASDDGGAAPA